MEKTELQVKLNDTVNSLIKLEDSIKSLREQEKKFEGFRAQLYELMTELGVDTYEAPNGTTFTRVKPGVDKTEIILDFDSEKLKQDDPILYRKYIVRKEKFTKGRNGYIRVNIKEER